MRHSVKFAVMALLGLVMLQACDKQKSVQEYYVEKQENNNFIAIDLPASMVSLDESASE